MRKREKNPLTKRAKNLLTKKEREQKPTDKVREREKKKKQ